MAEACEVGALSPTQLKILLFDPVKDKRKYWPQRKETGLKDEKNRGLKTKDDTIKILPT